MTKSEFIIKASQKAMEGFIGGKHNYGESSTAMMSVSYAEALYERLVQKGYIVEDDQS